MTQLSPKPSLKSGARIYFVTARTSQGKALLQSDRMASLFVDVLRSFRNDSHFKVNEFVVMRNFVELLITVNGETTVEEALRRIKYKFANRAALSFNVRGWIWDRDIKAVFVPHRAAFLKHKAAMEQGPVNAGLADSAEEYPYCSAYLRKHRAVAETTGT